MPEGKQVPQTCVSGVIQTRQDHAVLVGVFFISTPYVSVPSHFMSYWGCGQAETESRNPRVQPRPHARSQARPAVVMESQLLLAVLEELETSDDACIATSIVILAQGTAQHAACNMHKVGGCNK